MFKTIISSKKFLLIFSVVAFVTLTLAILFKGETTPKLMRITPPDSSRNFSVIGISTADYNIPIAAASVQITSIPQNDWVVRQKGEKSLEYASQKPLLPQTTYSLDITWNNKPLHTYALTTEDTQTDYELLDKLETKLERDYPLAKLVPYKTANYRIVYSAPLTLEATIGNPNLTSVEVIEELKAWVAKNGGDANAHKYVIAPPSAPPSLPEQ